MLGVCLGHQALAHVDRRRDRPCARGHARAAERDPPRRARPVRRRPAGLRGRALPLAGRRRGARDPARDGVDARRRRHGARAPRRARCGACSSTPSRSPPSTARALLRNFRDLTHAQRRRRRARRGPPADRRPAPRVHHRTLDDLVRPRGRVRRALRRPRPRRLARQRARGAGPRALLVHGRARRPARPGRALRRRDARAHRRSAGEREELRESVLDYCERELARLRADAPELPFDFTCGFAGYLGYELKAECGGDARAPLPAARRRARVLRPADRVRPRRAPRPPARARRRDERRRRRGMAGDHRAPARRPRPAGAARAGRAPAR